MTKRTKKLDLIDALLKVRECLSLLPDDQERQRLTHIIPEIIKELDVLRESIGRFPDTLKDKPLLAEMLLPKKAKPRKTKSCFVDVDALRQLLEGLPTEKILEELTKHKKDVLVELSTKLNITANKKLTKDALADRIFKLGFANKRGYDLLSGKQAE